MKTLRILGIDGLTRGLYMILQGGEFNYQGWYIMQIFGGYTYVKGAYHAYI